MSAPKRQHVILIVDDEAIVTDSLSAFLELETDHKVIACQSPVAALDTLRKTPVDVVISDFLMPEMNGLQFLAEAKVLYPDVPRIMLTGYADKENSIRAINEVGLFQYIEKPWDNDQLKLLVQNAVDNTSLREVLRQRIRELDAVLLERDRLAVREEHLREELQMASRLQKSMLPETLSGANGITFSAHYEPALDVGGDFYDVIPLAGDRVAVLVADATGHGIQAALSTAVVKFAFSHFRNRDVGPGDIVREMNRMLLRGLPADTFAAASVVEVDMKSARCRIANAGLPHPFVLRRGKKDAERVIANGMMLGIFEDQLFEPEAEQVVQLDRGDFLFLYTDGIGEAENGSGEQFDHSALRHQLLAHAGKSGEDISNAIVAATREFARADHAWDDVTTFGIDFK